VSQIRLDVIIGGTVGLATVTAILSYWTSDRIAQRRALAGCCSNCGYDLRASEERCPECRAPLPVEVARRRRIAANSKAGRGVNAVEKSEVQAALPQQFTVSDQDSSPT